MPMFTCSFDFRDDVSGLRRGRGWVFAGRTGIGGRGQPTAIDRARVRQHGGMCSWCRCASCLLSSVGDAAGEIRGRNWDEVSDAYAERAARHHRALRAGACAAKILGRSVFSLVDLERENPNLIGGDNLSGSQPSRPELSSSRPVAGYSRYKTPVGSASMMCGASTRPGAAMAPALVSCWGKCWRARVISLHRCRGYVRDEII